MAGSSTLYLKQQMDELITHCTITITGSFDDIPIRGVIQVGLTSLYAGKKKENTSL